jgi:hypothetical protein
MKCPTCKREGYALPGRTYPSGEARLRVQNIRFRRTGEFRTPKKGEWYLSGAIPAAYEAHADFDTEYYIVTPG